MSTSTELRATLENNRKQFEIDQRVVKRQLNSAMKAEADEQIRIIKDNYNMGMLTLHEMVGQQIDVLKYLFDKAYSFEEVK